MKMRFDKLGLVIAPLLCGALFAPFATYRANRIVAGEGKSILAATSPLPGFAYTGELLIILLLSLAILALLRNGAQLRLLAAIGGLIGLGVAVGLAGIALTLAGSTFCRVSPASGFWVALLALFILFADAAVRLRLTPLARLAGVVIAGAVLTGFLWSGLWSDLSVLKEFANRAGNFWHEAATHLLLALGSLAAAIATGLPLGIAIERRPKLRGPVLNMLNVVQTIPSIALFGMLIAPLAWLATTVPALGSAGINGIGFAPAFIALFLYSLLPMTANTLIGLTQVPRDVVDAARGMGFSARQLLFEVELPLAFTVILTGIRIVLVQNIGLAAIAALIGGGGFGVFIFQGISQTATDLILLGTIPTVVLALGAAVVMDAVIEFSAKMDVRGKAIA
jgi:osmoprotectant transport system permease protein